MTQMTGVSGKRRPRRSANLSASILVVLLMVLRISKPARSVGFTAEHHTKGALAHRAHTTCTSGSGDGTQISPKSELCGWKWANTHNKCVHDPM